MFIPKVSSELGSPHSYNSPLCTLDGSIEAEIITFLQKKEAILFFYAFSASSYKYFNMAPLPELIIEGAVVISIHFGSLTLG